MRRYYQNDPREQEALVFGELCIQPTARKVLLSGEEVVLSSHEYDLLLALAAQRIKTIWGKGYLFIADAWK